MEEIVGKYLQQEASEEEKVLLLKWLQENEENKVLFSELRDIWLASGKGHFTTPAYINQAYNQFTHNIKAYRQCHKQRSLTYFTQIAAAILLLIICSGTAYYMGVQKYAGDIRTSEVVMNHFIMGKDSKGSIILPDGTVAWLHSESKLSYPQIFSEKERRVQLEGEGYFVVSRKEKRPFYVETNEMEVKVLGTRFDVKNYTKQNIVETTLLSGKVEVFFPALDKKILLVPNQKIQFNQESESYKVNEVNALDYILWINDKITFTDESLARILFKMERWYNIEIGCAKGVEINQRLSLTIRRELKEEIFKALEMIAPIRCTINGNKVMVNPK